MAGRPLGGSSPEGWEDGGVILLGAVLALFIAWTLIAITTAWMIVKIVLLALRILWALVFAFVRWGSRRPRHQVVVLDR